MNTSPTTSLSLAACLTSKLSSNPFQSTTGESSVCAILIRSGAYTNCSPKFKIRQEHKRKRPSNPPAPPKDRPEGVPHPSTIANFTKRQAAELQRLVDRFDLNHPAFAPGSVWALRLDVPWDRLSANHWKSPLFALLEELLQRFPLAFILWRLEPTCQLLPHYHLLIGGVSGFKKHRSWFLQRWLALLNREINRGTAAKHGGQPIPHQLDQSYLKDGSYIRRTKSPERYARYMGKRLQRVFFHEDRQPIKQLPAEWAGSGHAWGVVGADNIPLLPEQRYTLKPEGALLFRQFEHEVIASYKSKDKQRPTPADLMAIAEKKTAAKLESLVFNTNDDKQITARLTDEEFDYAIQVLRNRDMLIQTFFEDVSIHPAPAPRPFSIPYAATVTNSAASALCPPPVEPGLPSAAAGGDPTRSIWPDPEAGHQPLRLP